MLIGVARGQPQALGDETTAPTRVLASGRFPQSDLAATTFNKYEKRWRPRGGSSIARFRKSRSSSKRSGRESSGSTKSQSFPCEDTTAPNALDNFARVPEGSTWYIMDNRLRKIDGVRSRRFSPEEEGS
ncbi:hypothetical protein EAG_04116 [Camponotus floridanus]|uniref:Uncharacterized protein n=1 Tax=Camponotus floridanus TaxID=104421 RepID=E1ZVB8_CAMFO|nr:hypothetical protein EAG_04116 [Camponotus floridanus]